MSDENKAIVLTVRVTKDEAKTIDVIAEKSGRTRSETLRRLFKLIDTPEAKKILGIDHA